MQNLSKSDEQKLLDGVKKAVDLVDNAGLSPNQAMKKVAEELQYSPGFLKAACNAFNNGRQLAQWNANDSILDKMADFPLASYEEIQSEMWGEPQEKVATFSYSGIKLPGYDDQFKQELLNLPLSSTEKAASEDLHPLAQDELITIRAKKSYDYFDFARKVWAEARRVKAAANDELEQRIGKLQDYFKKSAYDRKPFSEVEYAASVYYGEAGKALMSHVHESCPHEKTAEAYGKAYLSKKVDRSKEPYSLIDSCIKQATVLSKATDDLQDAETKLAEAQESFDSFSLPRQSENKNGSQSSLTQSLIEDLPGQKSASLLGGIAGGAGMGVAKSIADSATQNYDKALKKQIQELDSPEHTNELRKIRAQTVLTQLMSDPESPLSGYDPEEVLTAYNDLVQFSPRLADQPSAIAPLLNRRLVGNTEPFEVGEQLKLEEGLKKVQDDKPSIDLMRNEESIIS